MNKGYLFERNGIYQLRRSIKGKRVAQSLGVSTLAEAEAARDKVLAEAEAERLGPPPADVPVSDGWGIFENSPRRRQCSESTLSGYRVQWERFVAGVAPAGGFANVSRGLVSLYLGALRGAVGPNTWNKHLSCLRYVWRVVVLEAGLSLPDPFAGIPGQSVPLVRHEAFTTDQIRAMYALAPAGWPELPDIILTASHTGLRRIDCLTLTKTAYNRADGLLRVIPRKTRRTGATAVIGVSEALESCFERRFGEIEGEYVFPEAVSLMNACPQTYTARFQRFMVKTLCLNGDGGLYGMHSFRHWFSTRLTEAGVPDAVIDCMMAHGQSRTRSRYIHPSADVLRQAVATLPDVRCAGVEA
jgi:integrase